MWKKVLVIAAALLFVSSLHFMAWGKDVGLHLLHQELFFVPIILGSFWFGIQIGLLLSVVVSVLYTPAMFSHMHDIDMQLSVYAQIVLYFLIALLIGWLSESRAKKEQDAVKRREAATIGRAAAAISYEIKDVVSTLENLFKKSDLQLHQDSKEFDFELRRLNKLFNTLSKFQEKESQITLSTDLLPEISSAIVNNKDLAKKSEVNIRVEKSPDKCTTTAWTQGMEAILTGLIKNGVEASARHQDVIIRSRKSDSNCVIEVINQGTIAPDIENKLFKPFFTTKNDGQGLAIAAGRKIMRDHGGDLLYTKQGNSTLFQLVLPRESVRQSIEEIIENKETDSR